MAVLSIQSHVVYGYAGNTAAVFPLQRLGNEVWAINTVEFSNHTGYGSWKGEALNPNLISDLVTGIQERGVLNRCSAVLSGYLGSAEVSEAILQAVKKVKSENPDALYCCDPVMGDVGRGFYVKPDIPNIFKTKLIQEADIVCPNQFELEALSGITVTDIESAKKAISIIHDMGPSIVLVTSYTESADTLSLLVSGKTNNELYKVTTPLLPLGAGVAGTGDLTTSVFLSRYLETKNLQKTLELCASAVFSILEKSHKMYYNQSESINLQLKLPVELKLTEAQTELSSPSYSFEAVKI